MADPAPLVDRIDAIGRLDADAILDRFLGWVADRDLEPYPAQEEAFLEIMAGRHVVLETPTGSGKSLVALALHFKALCEGRRSFYTAPIKALASEKFFALCEDLGPENVGMLTGDASINAAAPVICCTAEVLANMALRGGASARVPYVVMDEFHFYGDRDRGWAWQVPLLCMPDTTFLLMSATLGDTSEIRADLERRSSREVALVHSEMRPVPLDYEYRDTPLHETVEALLDGGRAPVYVVSFTQRDCAELAQSLTSARVADKPMRQRISTAIGDFRFDSPYGKDIKRILGFGIGLHHAGLLPKYRLLVEQLSQQGLLRVICGTDTLGVGVNIPIRTVLFTKLSKYDGQKVSMLRVREFKQISGRAGRKGFDERGSVVCQAPDHVIENRRIRERAAGKAGKGGRGGKRKTPPLKKAPPGFVAWTEDTFRKLIERPPERLASRFRMNHGMMVQLLRAGEDSPDPAAGYRGVISLIDSSHEGPLRRRRLRRDAAQICRSLRAAGIVEVVPDSATSRRRLRVHDELQWDFSLHHALSLYVVDAVAALDRDAPDYAPRVLSVVEAVLEDPRALLRAQLDRLKGELMAQLKAERVPYEERIRLLDEVVPPQPDADFLYETFDLFAARHPFVVGDELRPKSIARELFESFASFADYVRGSGLQRMEGLLLRYLSQVYGSLVQSVPEWARNEALFEMIAHFRSMLERVDSSLAQEWESLLHPAPRSADPEDVRERSAYALLRDERERRARIRADVLALVHALATRDYEQASRCVYSPRGDPWPPQRFEEALAPYFAQYERLVFDERARHAEHTQIRPDGPRRWNIVQTLLDPEDDHTWFVELELDLRDDELPEGPLLTIRRLEG